MQDFVCKIWLRCLYLQSEITFLNIIGIYFTKHSDEYQYNNKIVGTLFMRKYTGNEFHDQIGSKLESWGTPEELFKRWGWANISVRLQM